MILRKHYYTLILILLIDGLFITRVAQADVSVNPTVQSASSSNVSVQYVPKNVQLIQDFCPPVQNLVRNPLRQTWSATNGWKTSAPSFMRVLETFVGAQWIGVTVGRVLCIYAQLSRQVFPVMLDSNRLVPAPTSMGMWSEDKGGYMECKSTDVSDCPFFVQVPKPPGDIYKQLNFFKKKTTPDQITY